MRRCFALSAVWRRSERQCDVILIRQIVPSGQDAIPFHTVPEIVGRYLGHPEPIVIPYTIRCVFGTAVSMLTCRVDQDWQFHPKCFDIPIEVEDPLKSKMAQLLHSFEGDEGREIVKLEDKVGELAYFARDLTQKRDFMDAFA